MNMISSSAWLPETALSGGAVERAVAEAVSAWSETWFSRRLMRVLGPGLPAPAAAPADEYVSAGDGIGIVLAPSARLALAGLLLDCEVPRALSAADRAVMDGLESGCIEDLCREASACFGLSAPRGPVAAGAPSDKATSFALGLSDAEPLLRLVVDRSVAVAMVKARAVRGARAVRLQPMAAALALQTVEVGARVGACAMSLSDLAGLEAGDVILLDRPLDDPLDLVVGGIVQAGRCTAAESADRLHLKMLSPLSGRTT